MTDPLTPLARTVCDAMSAGFPAADAGARALRAAARAGVGVAPVREVASVTETSAAGVRVRIYDGSAAADGAPADASAPDGGARNAATTADGSAPDDDARDTTAPADASAPDTSAPDAVAGPPVVVFFHGGGWVLCDLDTHDGLCRELAHRTGGLVVSADYRRAPEHRFPAAEDDAYAVLVWAAERYGGRPFVVAGDSSGGNLAAAVALRARDRGGPALTGQLLFYPALDQRLDGVSASAYAEGFFHTTAHMRWYWQEYLGPDGDPVAASPGLAPDLTALPPALVVLADCDPLRDEGLAYARRLSAAGVLTQVQLHTGMFHGFLGAAGVLPEADTALGGAAAWLAAVGTPS
ncbi:alpha/beta hydrolase [Streptomyces sp. NPDC000410]|uniref:alpha/beta hydrolase n=1 Tax=Streptomyces sp. NPDC000410 TaxID=3154254 RepID=UPI003333B43F